MQKGEAPKALLGPTKQVTRRKRAAVKGAATRDSGQGTPERDTDRCFLGWKGQDNVKEDRTVTNL